MFWFFPQKCVFLRLTGTDANSVVPPTPACVAADCPIPLSYFRFSPTTHLCDWFSFSFQVFDSIFTFLLPWPVVFCLFILFLISSSDGYLFPLTAYSDDTVWGSCAEPAFPLWAHSTCSGPRCHQGSPCCPEDTNGLTSGWCNIPSSPHPQPFCNVLLSENLWDIWPAPHAFSGHVLAGPILSCPHSPQSHVLPGTSWMHSRASSP